MELVDKTFSEHSQPLFLGDGKKARCLKCFLLLKCVQATVVLFVGHHPFHISFSSLAVTCHVVLGQSINYG